MEPGDVADAASQADRLDAQRIVTDRRDRMPAGLVWCAAVTGQSFYEDSAWRTIIDAEVARWQARIPNSRVFDLRK